MQVTHDKGHGGMQAVMFCPTYHLRIALARGFLWNGAAIGVAALSDRCLKGMRLKVSSQMASLGLYFLCIQKTLRRCTFQSVDVIILLSSCYHCYCAPLPAGHHGKLESE